MKTVDSPKIFKPNIKIKQIKIIRIYFHNMKRPANNTKKLHSI